MVFIAHDLAVVKNVSDRVAVMYLGKLCEVAPPEVLYHRPEHPYTEALLSSIPEPNPGAARDSVAALSGDLPSPVNPPSGCRFRTRCAYAQQRCADEEPQMRAMGPDHFVACHFPLGGDTAPVSAATRPAWVTGPSPETAREPAPEASAWAQEPPSWIVQAPDSPPRQAPSPPPAPPVAAPPRAAPAPPPPSSPAPVPPGQGGERTPLWIDPAG
jgi:oligopeptide/dipeptide ABC transporter ATP-binding protein